MIRVSRSLEKNITLRTFRSARANFLWFGRSTFRTKFCGKRINILKTATISPNTKQYAFVCVIRTQICLYISCTQTVLLYVSYRLCFDFLNLLLFVTDIVLHTFSSYPLTVQLIFNIYRIPTQYINTFMYQVYLGIFKFIRVTIDIL